MTLMKIENVIIPASDENGNVKFVVGIKLGDREPAIVSHQNEPVVFDTREQAQEYIDEDL